MVFPKDNADKRLCLFLVKFIQEFLQFNNKIFLKNLKTKVNHSLLRPILWLGKLKIFFGGKFNQSQFPGGDLYGKGGYQHDHLRQQCSIRLLSSYLQAHYSSFTGCAMRFWGASNQIALSKKHEKQYDSNVSIAISKVYTTNSCLNNIFLFNILGIFANQHYFFNRIKTFPSLPWGKDD